MAFNRASQYIRTATAELMKTHSRPGTGSQAARQISTPTQIQARTPRTIDSKSNTRGVEKGVSGKNMAKQQGEHTEMSQGMKGEMEMDIEIYKFC